MAAIKRMVCGKVFFTGVCDYSCFLRGSKYGLNYYMLADLDIKNYTEFWAYFFNVLQPMLHIPFDIAIDPMERLLLVNFEKDPDSLYVGFEPQVFDDGVTGKGHLVIGWRKDGRVDVYHEPGLRPDAQKYDIAGKGLAHMVEREMTHASFEVNDRGVQAHYEFQDLQERNVLIRINENHSRKRKPFGLLAPMGDVAENPSAMPLVLLQDFYFVRKKHSEVAVSVAGRSHRADMLPLPIDGNKMTFIRYSTAPLIATFNPAFSGTLPTVAVQEGHNLVRHGHREIHLEWLKGKPAVRGMVLKTHVTLWNCVLTSRSLPWIHLVKPQLSAAVSASGHTPPPGPLPEIIRLRSRVTG